MNNINNGDWVYVDTYTYPKKIKDISYYSSGYYNFDIFEFENNIEKIDKEFSVKCKLWKIKENEICWFYDDISFKPILGKFIKMTNDNKYLVSIADGKGILELKEFNFVEPFSGEINRFN